MDERQIKQAVHAVAQQEVSDSVDLWPALQSELDRPRRTRPALRLGRLAAAMLILLMAGAAVYAVDRLLQTGDPGLEAVQEENLGVQLDLSRTQGSLTVTLDYAYADANRISILFSGKADMPPGESYVFNDTHLSDDQGHTFAPMFGGGGGGGGGGSPDEATPAHYEVLISGTASYDASIITHSLKQLNLRLELDAQPVITQPASPDKTPAPQDTTSPGGGGGGGGSGGGEGEMTASPQMVTVANGEPITFLFEFSIPFNPGHVLDTPQQATANGIEMTLQNLVAAPSMTRTVVCFAPPQPKARLQPEAAAWLLDVTVVVNDQEAIPQASLAPIQAETGRACNTYMIPQSPAQGSPNAEWSLTITRMRLAGSEDRAQVNAELEKQGIQLVPQPDGNFGLTSPEGMPYDEFLRLLEETTARFQEKIEGPWTFQFTLP